MKLKKYQKEYDRFDKYTRKAYNILINLYNELDNDKELKTKKDLSYIKNTFDFYLSNYSDILGSIGEVNFSKIKDIKPKTLNNLLILPLYEDKDIYVPAGCTVYDIYNPLND